jgi:predicted nucleic acid-binding protein
MIFLDANILLEYYLNRTKFNLVYELFDKGGEFCISILTIHIVYYYAEKQKFDLAHLEEFLNDFKVLKSDEETYRLAKRIRLENDFEDTLQVATAISNQVEQIITLDVKFYNRYKKLISIKLL